MSEQSSSTSSNDVDSLISLGVSVIETEAAAIQALSARIDQHFARACRILMTCPGRIIVCGIGKSGHIGAKLAATLASTGSPAFFVHAAEASHGDLGMFQPGDAVIAISYSGSSAELTALIPGIKRLGIPLISLCGNHSSPLAMAADVNLDTRVEKEACPLGLAPTSSTTAALVMGDALAITLLGTKGFTEEDFARSHPGGRLGRRLLFRVRDVMVVKSDCPICTVQTNLAEALIRISSAGLGMVAVVDEAEKIVGVFTDGDLRRSLHKSVDIHSLAISEVMSTEPKTIHSEALAVDALSLMQQHRISCLPVIAEEALIGIVTMHALVAAGVV